MDDIIHLPQTIRHKLMSPCIFCGYKDNTDSYWDAHTHDEDCPWHHVADSEARVKQFESLIFDFDRERLIRGDILKEDEVYIYITDKRANMMVLFSDLHGLHKAAFTKDRFSIPDLNMSIRKVEGDQWAGAIDTYVLGVREYSRVKGVLDNRGRLHCILSSLHTAVTFTIHLSHATS